MKKGNRMLVWVLGIWLSVAMAAAQIIIIPPPPHPPMPIPPPRPPIERPRPFEMREMSVDAQVRNQVAEVRVTQVVYNPNNIQIEAQYLFPVPADGTIQDFVLMVDGKEMPGKIHTREEARRIYEEIVRRQRDPALLEYMGQGVVQTSVFPIPPRAERKLTLRFTQVLRADSGAVDFTYPLGTEKIGARPIERMTMRVGIESAEPIKSIYSPTHEVRIRRDGDLEAEVSWEKTSNDKPGDFKLIYTLAKDPIGASLISWRPEGSDDGFFMLLASPSVEDKSAKALDKTVILVLDRSGSMSGSKIEQARKALKFVLERLGPGDTFNVVVYDDRVESFRPELQRNDDASRRAALDYVDGIRPGGSTNINDALARSLAMATDPKRPSYIIFLTDGLPTAGEQNEMKISENAQGANKAGARLFCFGVGNDVNTRLLDRLARQGGASQFVAPSEDVEAPVARLYTKLSSPVLAGLKIELAGTDVNRAYPRDLPDLFRGEQLVWVGRYRKSGPVTIKLSGKLSGDGKSFEFKGDLAEPGQGRGNDFIERVWAGRRIGFLIDQIDLNGKKDELVNELVELSKKYGILTPYTSFLAEENVPIVVGGGAGGRDLADQASMQLESLGEVQGERAVAQRRLKGAFSADKVAPAAAALSAPMRQAMPEVARQMEKAADTIRQVGPKTFYLRDGRWIDSELTEADVKSATEIEKFGDKYFELVGAMKSGETRYLAFEEPVVVKLAGKAYLFK